MEKGERSSFILYHQFANFFALLSMEERGELITAIFDYDVHGREPKALAPVVQMAFVAIRDALDRDHAAYAAKCERNAVNGRRGGRPRKDFFAPKTERFFEKPKKADYEYDLEHDLDLDHDLELDREQEQEHEREPDAEPAPVREAESLPMEATDPDRPVAHACARDAVAPNAQEALPLCDEGFFALPCDPIPPTSGLSEEDLRRLTREGVSRDYVAGRLERAVAYVRERGGSIREVLLRWWRIDQIPRPVARARAAPVATSPIRLGCSFDTEDFFRAALRRSLGEGEGVMPCDSV